jgi:hypothetical protein
MLDAIENAMYKYVDIATETDSIKDDPVNSNHDPVNDPVNSFDVLELIKATPDISYDELVK